jgi:Helix-turn-helix domain
MEKDRIEMSQRERDVLKVMSLVLKGERTQVEAARLLRCSSRQVYRILQRLQTEGDAGLIHRLRGKPSNRRTDPSLRRRALSLYRKKYLGFGPTLAGEKLNENDKVCVPTRTLREWLLAEGLWQRQRCRDRHRQRRVRRSCFGEMVQADASEHDWLEGRGPMLTLAGMIDDATDRVVLRFYPSETTTAYMDVLRRWIERFGRPASWYSDRHGIFRAEEKVSGYDQKQSVLTQFSRALGELGMELILANSPQAKGRVERLWGTAQDRLVKELRLAKARTIEQANAVLDGQFVAWFNRRCTHKAASVNDAHRPVGRLDLAGILSMQQERVVGNDYTIRYENQAYQLLPPTWPGLRGGKVIVQRRLDGSMKIHFKGRYLTHQLAPMPVDQEEEGGQLMGALPPNPRSLPHEPIPAGKGNSPAAVKATGPDAVHRTGRRSGRTPAEPCLPAGGSSVKPIAAYRPAPNHPWRQRACG